jgi:hypothetical protein
MRERIPLYTTRYEAEQALTGLARQAARRVSGGSKDRRRLPPHSAGGQSHHSDPLCTHEDAGRLRLDHIAAGQEAGPGGLVAPANKTARVA